MTAPAPFLHELSHMLGILPDYYDIWGNLHATSDATRKALLAAMDIHADDETSALAALTRWRQRHWHQPLPPVQVVPTGESARVLLRLPLRAQAIEHRWRVVFEEGGQVESSFIPESLQEVESAEFSGELWHARELVLPACEAWGYHRLELWRGDDLLAEMPLIVHPRRAYQPSALEQGVRLWGVSVQLYGLRSQRNFGMGDYADLARLIDWAAETGASLVGVNPLHALFPHDPEQASPYSPSSRQFFNVLYLAIEELPEWHECVEAQTAFSAPAFQTRLRALQDAPLVDYAAVAAAKRTILERLYAHFRAQHLTPNSDYGQAFRAWFAAGGEALRGFSLYHALQEHLQRQDTTLWGWPVWPEIYRRPDAPAVQDFAQRNAEAIEWHAWLQWHAERQLAAAAQRARARGLQIGLYLDLAVGVNQGGAETWLQQELYAQQARVGCPPDDFNPLGQDWGLPPWIPQRLRAAAYAPFIAMLRANMKYAGALRIDHVMGLMRLYWVPPAMTADQGAYVAYPFSELLGILALESQRNRCLIVGEDLGTVPGEVRAALYETGVLSYRLFYFEREHGGALPAPERYTEHALLAASTHDLPTLAGYWNGRDIDWRQQLGLYPHEDFLHAQRAEREIDRRRILQALHAHGLLPEGLDADAECLPAFDTRLAAAIYRYLARSPARLVLAQAEDLCGEIEQANIPGTLDTHPNWRRKLALAVEDWFAPDCPPRQIATALRAERA